MTLKYPVVLEPHTSKEWAPVRCGSQIAVQRYRQTGYGKIIMLSRVREYQQE
jgi:hypothetical protein